MTEGGGGGGGGDGGGGDLPMDNPPPGGSGDGGSERAQQLHWPAGVEPPVPRPPQADGGGLDDVIMSLLHPDLRW
jgi:hypothetical protein